MTINAKITTEFATIPSNMYCRCCFIFLAVLSVDLSKASPNKRQGVEYYTQLVEEGVQNALNYELPTDAGQYKPNNSVVKDYGLFDFIIIGSGASGSALAGRLAKLEQFSTLVLEAGTFEDDFVRIPGMYYYDRGSSYNWGFTSIPQTTCCLGMVERKCPYPRGKGFGGTTLINGLIYSRGNRRDFDRWAAEGNPGWNYQTVLKHFIRMENSSINGDAGYHGKEGELNVQYHPIESAQTRKFIQANNEFGIPEVDYNGALQHGVSRIQSNIRNGQRLSAYRAFLEPVLGSKNLRLLPNSYVTKIYVNESSNRREVYFSHRQQLYKARAKKEIILSAGTISSPQILMLSGIGPENHLRELKIPVVKNLQVGSNLQDHTAYYGTYFRTNFTDPRQSVQEYIEDYMNETGFYTVAANLQGIGYYETPSNTERGYSDAELIIVPSPILNNYTRTAFRFTNETFQGLWGSVNGENSFIVYIILLRPESKGTIRLRSNDPYAYPLIDAKFLSDRNNRDIRKVYEMIQFVHRLQRTRAFRSIDAQIGAINLPACRRFKRNSRDQWYCNIRHLTFNLYHPVGTNKMGPNPNSGAVVDSRFRVHGFRSLRVVDASVLPFSFAGHPAASAMMIGDRAFEFIAEDHA